MKANENGADRAVRIIIGVIALAASYQWLSVMDGNIWGIVVAALGAIMLITGFVGFCPCYAIFGMGTCKKTGCCGGGESCGCSKPE
jgi:DUF2892 family protein